MPVIEEPICATCHFWRAAAAREDLWGGGPTTPVVAAGACHHSAPRAQQGGYAVVTVWPPTLATEWCGEWESGERSRAEHLMRHPPPALAPST